MSETSTAMTVVGHGAPRVPPPLTEATAYYWQAGAAGELRILRCQDCGYYIHPWTVCCAVCMSTNLAAERVSGNGRVYTFSVNHRAWNPLIAVPYVIAVVELDEQPGLRVITNIIDCDPEIVRCEMPVEVRFERFPDDAPDVREFGPLFAPVFVIKTEAS
jgi:uncharacterized OB-fold protein